MQLLVLRRLVVSARARGMPEITNQGKLFLNKNRWRPVASRSRLGAHGNDAPYVVSIVREMIRPRSGWRTKHLVAIDITPVPMTGRGFFVVRRDDCSAPGRQTQDQTPIGCDTHDATMHGTSAASRGICSRISAEAGAFGR